LDQGSGSSFITLAELKKAEACKLNRKQHSDLKRTWYHKANTHKQHVNIMNQDIMKHNLHEQLGRQKMPRHWEGNQLYYIPTIINGILS
jgi:hypothetical protein